MRFIVAAVPFCTGQVFILKGVFTNISMFDELNKALPEDKRFDPIVGPLSRQFGFRREYRAMFPKSRKIQRMYGFFVIGATLMFTALVIVMWHYNPAKP